MPGLIRGDMFSASCSLLQCAAFYGCQAPCVIINKAGRCHQLGVLGDAILQCFLVEA